MSDTAGARRGFPWYGRAAHERRGTAGIAVVVIGRAAPHLGRTASDDSTPITRYSVRDDDTPVQPDAPRPLGTLPGGARERDAAMAMSAVRAAVACVLLGAGFACAERSARTAGDSSAGDSSAPRAGDDPAAAFRAQLGRTWELARLGDAELPPSAARPAPRNPAQHPGPDTRPTIRFTTDTVPDSPPDSVMWHAGGRSFCNGYGAAYVVGPGDRLRFGRFQSTLVGCGDPEERFFRALHASRRVVVRADTLLLLAEDGSALTFVVPRP